jgi:hypothetical protein
MHAPIRAPATAADGPSGAIGDPEVAEAVHTIDAVLAVKHFVVREHPTLARSTAQPELGNAARSKAKQGAVLRQECQARFVFDPVTAADPTTVTGGSLPAQQFVDTRARDDTPIQHLHGL